MSTASPTSRSFTSLALLASTCVAFAAAGCDDDGEAADPCDGITCSGHGTCSVAGDAAVCTCDAGFTEDGTTCIADVADACEGNECDVNATCNPDGDVYSCECNAGYSGDGTTCVADVADACAGNECDVNATCTPDGEDYTCECNAGFSGDGTTCAPDVVDACEGNECDVNPPTRLTSVQRGLRGAARPASLFPLTPDGDTYTCECNAGFSGDGTTCTLDGESCDPDAEENACAYTCLPLDAGGGVCVDVCEEDAQCPQGWRCDTELAPEGEPGLCLPNAACGELTSAGECDGSVLRYCGYEGPLAIDCAEADDGTGQALACRFLSDDVGYDCVSAAFTGGCGEVTFDGNCNGTVLTYCESQENGNVVTVDCADGGLTCVTDAGGNSDCAPSGASGCGNVTSGGTCDGTTATWCEDYEVKTADCADSSQICGGDGDTFRCVTPLAGGGASSVSGSFVFQKKALSSNGLGALSNQPARNALVTVRKASDNARLAEGYTGQDGSFSLQFEASEEVYVLVTAQGEPGKHNHVVRDCPMDDCADGLGNIYGARSANFSPSASGDLGETAITVASGNAGAFNIHDVFVRGADFAKANMGRYPPMVIVQWRSGQATAGGTSYFTGENSRIYILGGAADTDEFDDPVLLHEYGHYLEHHLSRADSPGGAHDGSPTDPRLAWGEGYGTYVGCAIADTPLYIDTSAAGASLTDVRSAGSEYPAQLNDPKGMKQLLSEHLISQILWTIAMGPDGANGKSHTSTFDVLANYFTSFTTPSQGRGVAGVELVDFLDGWFCKQHGDRPFIQGIINETAKFPYDYAGPATCN